MDRDLNALSENLKSWRKTRYNHLPEYMQAEFELEQLYTDFILSYLVKCKNYQGTFDVSVIEKNGIMCSYKEFFEGQKAISWGYVDVVRKSKNSMTLKLTNFGVQMFNDEDETVFYETIQVSFYYRFKKKIIRSFKNLMILGKEIIFFIKDLFISLDELLSRLSDSGFVKLLLVILAILTFIFSYIYIVK